MISNHLDCLAKESCPSGSGILGNGVVFVVKETMDSVLKVAQEMGGTQRFCLHW